MLTTAEKTFEGAGDMSLGVHAGTGVEAFGPPLLSMLAALRLHCQDGPLSLSPFVCLWLPQADS